jgi:hypothetical protein
VRKKIYISGLSARFAVIVSAVHSVAFICAEANSQKEGGNKRKVKEMNERRNSVN